MTRSRQSSWTPPASEFRTPGSSASPPARKKVKRVAEFCSTEESYPEVASNTNVKRYIEADEKEIEAAKCSEREVIEVVRGADCRNQVCRGKEDVKLEVEALKRSDIEKTAQINQLMELARQHTEKINQLLETNEEHRKKDAQLILRSFSCHMERIACWLILRQKRIPLQRWYKCWSFEKLKKHERIPEEDIYKGRMRLASWLDPKIAPQKSTKTDVDKCIDSVFKTRKLGNSIAHPKVSDVDQSQFDDYAKLALGDKWKSVVPIYEAYDRMRNNLRSIVISEEEFNQFIDYAEA